MIQHKTAIQKVDFLGLNISSPANRELLHHIFSDGSAIVTFINPGIYFKARKLREVKALLDRFGFVFCDGVGLIYGLELLDIHGVERLSFDTTSVAPLLFEFCETHSKRILLVGGRSGVSESAKETILRHYPDIKIEGAYPGYGTGVALAADDALKKNVDVVICGMGAINQEHFLIDLKKRGWQGLGFTCGGYFDQLSRSFGYYKPWFDRYDLRFLFRLYKEPRRLWKRYFFEYAVYVFFLLRAFIKKQLRSVS